MSLSLQQIINRRAELAAERASAEAAHATFLRTTAAELAQLREAESLIVGGLDLEKVEAGRAVLDIRGRVTEIRHGFDYPRYSDANRSAVRSGCLEEAKIDLANGGDKIGRQYFGVKNYDGFGDQRNDGPYFTSPRHGSIVFSIGLTRELQQRVRTGPHLEDHEIEAALYLLSALPRIEELQADNKVAA